MELNIFSIGKKIIVSVILMSLVFSGIALAEDVSKQPNIPQGGGLVAPDKEQLPEELREDDFRTMAMRVISYFLSFLGLVAVAVILYGGVLMVIAAGDDEQFGKGKTAVQYSLVGIIVILLAYSLVNWVLGVASFDSDDNNGRITAGSTNTQNIIKKSGNLEEEINKLKKLYQDMRTQMELLNGMDENTLDMLDNMGQDLIDLKDRSPSNYQSLFDQLTKEINELKGVGDQIINNNYSITKDNEMKIIEKVKKMKEEITLLEETLAQLPVMVASITATPNKGNSPLTVKLDGRGSYDPNNQTIPDSNYHWSYIDSDGALRVLPSRSIIETTFDTPSKYIIKLRVETSSLSNGQKSAIDGVAYYPINVDPPSAEVGIKINGKKVFDTIKISKTQAEDGVSFDPLDSNPGLGNRFIMYKWDFGDNIKEEYDSPFIVTHKYAEEGSYKVRLSIIDDKGETNTRNIVVQVQSLLADIDLNNESGTTLTSFIFDASNSTTDEGEVVEFEWKIIKKGEELLSSEEMRFNHQFDEPGDYEIRLKVKDTLGREDTVIKYLKVESQPPISFFVYDYISKNIPSSRVFDATGTLDRDSNDDLTYSWDFDGDGKYDITDTKEKIVAFRYTKTGKYGVTLLTKDSFGAEDKTTKYLEIDSILDIDFDTDMYAAHADTPIKFTAKSNNAESYFWDFGDKSIKQTEKRSVLKTFKTKGVFKVTLTAFDDNNNETKVTKEIYIGNKDEPMAVQKAIVSGRESKVLPDICGEDKDGILVTRNDNIMFDAGLSLNIDGTNKGLKYSWDFGDNDYSTNKRSIHNYKVLTYDDECNKVKLVVQDLVTGKTDKSSYLYVRVVNDPPMFSKFYARVPKEKQITPVDISLEIAGAHDFDGKVDKYRFWYYYPDTDEKYGVQIVDKPFTTITVMPRGYEGEENEVYFGAEVIDNDGGKTSNIDLGLTSLPLAVVTGSNLPPEVVLQSDKTTVNAGDSIRLYADAKDPQGSTLKNDDFAWDLDGDGRYDDTSSGPQITHTYQIPGEYEVRVKVTSNGLSTTVSHTIYVDKITDYPKAAYLYEVTGLDVLFDGANSMIDTTVKDNSIKYYWDFDLSTDSDGDGDPANDIDSTEMVTKYTYDKVGVYKVKLTVEDILKVMDTVIHEISVGEANRNLLERKSLDIESISHPMTVLSLNIKDSSIKIGESSIIEATVLNGDGSTYEKEVLFEVIEGTGEFLPDQVKAINSKAGTLFKSVEKGVIIIKVTAKDAFYGDISEEIIIDVK